MWGIRDRFLFSYFLFASRWAPCAGAGPPPPPWRKPEGKSKAATRAESGGLRGRAGKDRSQGSRTHGSTLCCPSITRKPRILSQAPLALVFPEPLSHARQWPGAHRPSGSTTKVSSARLGSLAPGRGQGPWRCPHSESGLFSQQAANKSFQLPNFLSSCCKSSPWL